MKTRLLIAAVVALAQTALADPCPSRHSWPTKDWPTNTASYARRKAAEIKALEEYAFTLTGEDGERKGYRTDGLVIIKSGTIAYERYGRGFSAANKHISWSVAKSVSSMLAGIAVKEGKLSLDDSICKYLTEFAGRDQCRIKVHDVLTFATGLQWAEEYEGGNYQTSSVLAMLFGSGHVDQLGHILGHKVEATPGSRWQYSTGDAELLSEVVRRAMTTEKNSDIFWPMLFDKIGANVVFEQDARGTPGGGSFVYATPRDFAKFGYLMLNDGCWNDERILPEGWVKTSTTPSEAFPSAAPDEDTASGYMWWLNAPVAKKDNARPWKDVPDDTYAALGHWGQRIIVVPSKDVVIVRTGDDREGSIPVNDLVKLALAVVQ